MHPLLKILFVFAVTIIIAYICLFVYIKFLEYTCKDTKGETPRIRTFTSDELEVRDRQLAIEAVNKWLEEEDDAIHERRSAINEEQQKVIKKLRSE